LEREDFKGKGFAANKREFLEEAEQKEEKKKKKAQMNICASKLNSCQLRAKS
jgi:hypothetical protein